MGRHSAGKRNQEDRSNSLTARRPLTRKVASHALHPLTHIVALLSVALGILDQTPLLALLFRH